MKNDQLILEENATELVDGLPETITKKYQLDIIGGVVQKTESKIGKTQDIVTDSWIQEYKGNIYTVLAVNPDSGLIRVSESSAYTNTLAVYDDYIYWMSASGTGGGPAKLIRMDLDCSKHVILTENIDSLGNIYIVDDYLYYTYTDNSDWEYMTESHRINLLTLEDEICEPFVYPDNSENSAKVTYSFENGKLTRKNGTDNSVSEYSLGEIEDESAYVIEEINGIVYIVAYASSDSGPNTFFYSLDLTTSEIKLIGSWFTS